MVIEPQPGYRDSQSRVKGLLLAVDSCVQARLLNLSFSDRISFVSGVCVRFVWRDVFGIFDESFILGRRVELRVF